MNRLNPALKIIGLIANSFIIAIGVSTIATGSVVEGLLVALLGIYLFAGIVAKVAYGYGRIESVATVFAMSTFIAVPIWVIIVTALSLTTGGSIWLAAFALAASGIGLVVGIRGLVRWARVRQRGR